MHTHCHRFVVDQWTSGGVTTEPVTFVGGAKVTLAKANVATPPGISSQIRGFPPAFANLTVSRASTPPKLDGSMDGGWSEATAATYDIDGLNTDGPAHIETRLLHDDSFIYVRFSINQTETGWTYPLVGLEPANRMFTHGRGSTTCSMYIQGNVSAGYRTDLPPTGRIGDARFVFGVFNQTGVAANGQQLAVLGMCVNCACGSMYIPMIISTWQGELQVAFGQPWLSCPRPHLANFVLATPLSCRCRRALTIRTLIKLVSIGRSATSLSSELGAATLSSWQGTATQSHYYIVNLQTTSLQVPFLGRKVWPSDACDLSHGSPQRHVCQRSRDDPAAWVSDQQGRVCFILLIAARVLAGCESMRQALVARCGVRYRRG
jgi:hypothetical protein